MIQKIIEKYELPESFFLKGKQIIISDKYKLESDLQKYMDEEMIKFTEWIVNEDWIQTTSGRWEQVDPPFMTAENNSKLLEIYKNK